MCINLQDFRQKFEKELFKVTVYGDTLMFKQRPELSFLVAYSLLIASISKLRTNRRRNFCRLWLTEVSIDNLNYSYLRNFHIHTARLDIINVVFIHQLTHT
jgi:hypothetical protein